MKKLLALIFLSFIFLGSAAFSVHAYDFATDSGAKILGTKAGYTTDVARRGPEYYVGLVLSIIFSFLGSIFMVLTIYAGIKWMTAQGNTSQIDQAKDTITRAAIGLIICIVAYGLTFFVINIFQGGAKKNPAQTDTTNSQDWNYAPPEAF